MGLLLWGKQRKEPQPWHETGLGLDASPTTSGCTTSCPVGWQELKVVMRVPRNNTREARVVVPGAQLGLSRHALGLRSSS